MKLDITLFRERTRQFLMGLFFILFFIGIYMMASTYMEGPDGGLLGLVVLILSMIGFITTKVYLP